MQAHENGSVNAGARFTRPHTDDSGDLERLRVACRRQADVIDTLTEAIQKLRTGAAALRADNAELRADNERLQDRSADREAGAEGAQQEVFHLRLDVDAPGDARAAVSGALSGRVPASMVEQARLVVSELATNSVLHSGASPDGELVVRVQLADLTARVEVQDPGCAGPFAARTPDLHGGGGFGLHLVHALSERWGVERAIGETRVWAELTSASGQRGWEAPAW